MLCGVKIILFQLNDHGEVNTTLVGCFYISGNLNTNQAASQSVLLTLNDTNMVANVSDVDGQVLGLIITNNIINLTIYSKLYITPLQSTEMEEGYVSIANTSINPLLDDFILNFDYLYNLGSITDYQMNFINTYKVKMHEINN